MPNIAFFTVADKNNLPWANMMLNSLRKFHSEKEVDTFIYTEEDVGNPENYYRQKPMFGRLLLERGYDLVIGADADQVITGSLDHIFEDEMYDIGTVLNWNRVDPQKYPFPLTVWDIPNYDYFNCGFVSMRSRRFVEHWWDLCNKPNFVNYRFREQDLLNIACHYGDYNVRCFDHSNMWHGLISSGEWLNFELRGNELVLPVVNGYPEQEKIIKNIHYAGGNVVTKMNFDLNFKPEISNHLKMLTRGNNG